MALYLIKGHAPLLLLMACIAIHTHRHTHTHTIIMAVILFYHMPYCETCTMNLFTQRPNFVIDIHTCTSLYSVSIETWCYCVCMIITVVCHRRTCT